jgi:gas vesicle protein
MMKTRHFVLGTVLGTVAGAVTALLLAPKTGRELRGNLSFQVENLAEKTQKIANDVSERSQVLAKTLTEQTSQLAGKANVLANSVISEVKSWRDTNEETAADATQTKTGIKTENIN